MNTSTARLRLASAFTVLGLLLGACGSQPAPTSAVTPVPDLGLTAAPPVTAPVTADRPVTFMVFGDPAEYAAYQSLAAAFRQAHPEIPLELLHIPDQSDYRKRLAADFAAGTPADVVLINYRRYAGFALKGLLEPLGPYLAGSALISEDDFFPEALAPFRLNRTLMCIPQNVSSLAVYYNKDLFDQAGLPYPDGSWDWDEFLAVAQALTRDVDGDGRIDQYGLGIEPSLIRLAPFIWQNGADLVDFVVSPSGLELQTPAAKEAIQWFVDLQVEHHVVPSAEAEAAEPSETRFLNGRLAMFFNSRRGVPTYREITSFEWDVAPLPSSHGRHTNILHADAYCLASAAPNKAAAWAFIEFANSPTGQTIVAESGRTVPSLVEVAHSPAFLNSNEPPANNQVFLDNVANSRALPIVENWADIEEITSDELERAFYGHATVDEAIAAAMLRTEEYFLVSLSR